MLGKFNLYLHLNNNYIFEKCMATASDIIPNDIYYPFSRIRNFFNLRITLKAYFW